MEKLQNNSEIWEKIACDMQQLRVSQQPPPSPTLLFLLVHLSLIVLPLPTPQSLSSTTRTTEDLWRNWGCCCRNIPKRWNEFAASWDTGSPYSHALLFKTQYSHTEGRGLKSLCQLHCNLLRESVTWHQPFGFSETLSSHFPVWVSLKCRNNVGQFKINYSFFFHFFCNGGARSTFCLLNKSC